MEYFVGSVTTLLTIYIVNKLINKTIKPNTHTIRYNQSYTFELIKPFLSNFMSITPLKLTQSFKYENSMSTRVLFFEGKAYWIESNKLIEASIMPDGQVDQMSAEEVDTMGMNDVELNRTLFIVERLREGLDNDFGYPGNKNI